MDLSAFTFEALLPFIAIGFAAQLLDGALGMAFGVISNTLLISMGVPPAAASAGVHAAESFTTGASGISHIAHRNVDWKLFRRLVIPGVAGGVLGAYILSSVNAEAARPFVLAYLCAIGLYLLWRGIRVHPTQKAPKVVGPLGFRDAAGGAGWGAVVTSNLLVQGGSPRKVVGTVNTVEFFLAVSISATFIFTLGLAAFTIATAGLVIGGVVAAPLGALVTKRVPAKPLLILVGIVLTITSLYGVARAML